MQQTIKDKIAFYLFNEDTNDKNYLIAYCFNNSVIFSSLKNKPEPDYIDLFDHTIVLDLKKFRELYKDMLEEYSLTETQDLDECNLHFYDETITLFLDDY